MSQLPPFLVTAHQGDLIDREHYKRLTTKWTIVQFLSSFVIVVTIHPLLQHDCVIHWKIFIS